MGVLKTSIGVIFDNVSFKMGTFSNLQSTQSKGHASRLTRKVEIGGNTCGVNWYRAVLRVGECRWGGGGSVGETRLAGVGPVSTTIHVFYLNPHAPPAGSGPRRPGGCEEPLQSGGGLKA